MSQINVYKFSWNYILLKLLTLTSSVVTTEPLGQHSKHWHQLQYQHQQYEYLHPDPTSDPISSTTPGTRHAQITLSPTLRTQHVFAVLTNDTTFGFEISKEQRPQDVASDYKVNVVVESLTSWYHSDRRQPPCILIQGVTGGHKDKSVKFCYEIHNDLNNFQTVREAMDDLKLVTISAEGDWTNTQAKLVASIYYEVPDGCGNCAPDYFCCGIEGSTCSTNQRSISWGDEVMYRCIPMSGQYGDRNTDTICNFHPNCGFFCNLDESPGQCSGGAGDTCFGGDCNLTNVALRIAVLVIFCFLLPPVVILFLCRFNAIRSACNRVRGRLMSRGHRDSDATIGEAAEPSVATISRSRRERRSTQSYNPDEDPPPSYEDYLRHFKETESPLYNEGFPALASAANPCDVAIGGANAYQSLDLRRSSQRSDLDLNISGGRLSGIRSGTPTEIVGERVGGVANLGFIGDERGGRNS